MMFFVNITPGFGQYGFWLKVIVCEIPSGSPSGSLNSGSRSNSISLKRNHLIVNVLHKLQNDRHIGLFGIVLLRKTSSIYLLFIIQTCWLLGLTQVLISNRFPTKPSKLSALLVNQKANVAHRVHNAVSPEIALWGTAILRCLQSRKEWGLCFDSFPYASTSLIIHLLLGFIHH
jgi:hypothetical protein